MISSVGKDFHHGLSQLQIIREWVIEREIAGELEGVGVRFLLKGVESLLEDGLEVVSKD